MFLAVERVMSLRFVHQERTRGSISLLAKNSKKVVFKDQKRSNDQSDQDLASLLLPPSSFRTNQEDPIRSIAFR